MKYIILLLCALSLTGCFTATVMQECKKVCDPLGVIYVDAERCVCDGVGEVDIKKL